MRLEEALLRRQSQWAAPGRSAVRAAQLGAGALPLPSCPWPEWGPRCALVHMGKDGQFLVHLQGGDEVWHRLSCWLATGLPCRRAAALGNTVGF